jgi:hypothetical protein
VYSTPHKCNCSHCVSTPAYRACRGSQSVPFLSFSSEGSAKDKKFWLRWPNRLGSRTGPKNHGGHRTETVVRTSTLPSTEAAECEGVPARELPERLRSANAQCLCDEQPRRGQRGVAENLPATGKDQPERCPEPGRRAGRNADGASLGYRSGVAPETGHHQPDRIMLVDSTAGGAERKALARRRSAAALDRHRTLGSREKVPTHQRISRNPVAEGAPESIAPSAERGPDSRSCLNLVAGRLTVPNIESCCNQLKLGHPLATGISFRRNPCFLGTGVAVGATVRLP